MRGNHSDLAALGCRDRLVPEGENRKVERRSQGNPVHRKARRVLCCFHRTHNLLSGAMADLVLVALGGALGASLRFLAGQAAMRLLDTAFPVGTFFVNVTGSFVMGAIFAWLQSRPDLPPAWGLFLMTGILGGYTTFSAFSLEAILLWQRGEEALSLTYMLSSVAFSFAGLMAGMWIVRAKLVGS